MAIPLVQTTHIFTMRCLAQK